MVRGANSLWNGWMQLVYVGRRGQGDFTALDAGQVSSGAVYVGHEDGSVGGVTLAGAGTLWEASNVFVVGLGGEGALLVESEAALIATQLQIGLQSTAFGEATIVGDAAVTLSSGAGNAIQVGAGSGWGTLRIQKGSVVQAPGGASIGSSGGNGQVQVEGAGSLLSLGQNLVLGGFSGASAHLSVFDAGEAVCRAMFLYTDSTAHLTGVGTKLSTQVGGVGVGASTESGHLVVDNAAELITQTVTVYPGSTLQGRLGLITGAVSNRGELYPGMQTMTGADQISSFFIDGSFTQLSDGALHIDLNDLGAGPANDVLQVSGTAVIDGALVVSIVDNPPPAAMRSTFNPPLNTEYEVLTAASVSGAFASESLPALAGNRYLEVEYEAGRVLLVVRSTCPADLNNDNSVNGADLGLLLGEWGSAGGQADLSDDGTVNGADLGLLLGAWGACP